ncbi:MAG: nicotinamide riboside transporter PnuC [Candidatus Spyradocola sp.]|nr:nicotinamide riboside transporter PnuC [Candidatus Spyradocola sp.]
MHRLIHYFTKAERILWALSVSAVIAVFVLFDRGNGLALIASLIGVTSLLFNAKGNPVGQLLMIAFSALYGYISYTFCYFGEMVTYLGMTAPMAAVALVSWLKNPYRGNRAEVKVNQISRKEHALMWLLTALVTVLFYFILAHFRTANLLPSTLSVTTSFLAVYLTFRRSPYFALGYAANDMILIVLWTLAALEDLSYVSVAACFAVFLVNDLYGFLSWRKMEKRQAEA